MEDEVWLNIDYGQYEITKRTSDSAGAGIGGKIVTKVTVGNADDKVNFFRGCLQNVRIGTPGNSKLEVSSEKDLVKCYEVDSAEGTEEPPSDSQSCSGPSCFCPFASGKCVEGCELELCSSLAQCQSTTSDLGGYKCQCPKAHRVGNLTQGRYCDPIAKEVCPGHWWGSPVCGPCNCNVSLGFDEACDSKTGECRCKSNHYMVTSSSGDDVCLPCNCFAFGSVSGQCNVTSGSCPCKPGIR